MYKRVRFNQDHKAHSYYDNEEVFSQLCSDQGERKLMRRFTKIIGSNFNNQIPEPKSPERPIQIAPKKIGRRLTLANGKDINEVIQDIKAGTNPYFENMENGLLEEIKGKPRGKGWNVLFQIVAKYPKDQALAMTIQKLREQILNARKQSELSALNEKNEKKRHTSKVHLTLEDFKTSENAIDSEHFKNIQHNIQQLEDLKRDFEKLQTIEKDSQKWLKAFIQTHKINLKSEPLYSNMKVSSASPQTLSAVESTKALSIDNSKLRLNIKSSDKQLKKKERSRQQSLGERKEFEAYASKVSQASINVVDEYQMRDFRTTFSVTSHKRKGNFVKVLSSENRSLRNEARDSYQRDQSLRSPNSVYQSSTLERRGNMKSKYLSLLNKKHQYIQSLENSQNQSKIFERSEIQDSTNTSFLRNPNKSPMMSNSTLDPTKRKILTDKDQLFKNIYTSFEDSSKYSHIAGALKRIDENSRSYIQLENDQLETQQRIHTTGAGKDVYQSKTSQGFNLEKVDEFSSKKRN